MLPAGPLGVAAILVWDRLLKSKAPLYKDATGHEGQTEQGVWTCF